MKARCYLWNQRGIGLASTAFLLAALIAVTVVGVGYGRHSFTAGQVQTAAEAAAAAAATAKLNGKTDATAKSEGQAVAQLNYVDANLVNASMIPTSAIEIGNFTASSSCASDSNNCFTPGGMPVNAARATATATVPNVFPVSFGGFSTSQNYTVTKRATAAFSGLGTAKPALPLALCNACFNNCTQDSDCTAPTCSGGPAVCPSASTKCFAGSCMPGILTGPTGCNTVAWTGFSSGHSTSEVDAFMPAACDNKGGTQPPTLTAGSSTVDVTNGNQTPSYNDVECLRCTLGMCSGAACTTDSDCAGWTDGGGIRCVGNQCACLVPVFGNCTCGTSYTGTSTVVGFAAIVIDSFNYTSSGGDQTCVPCGGAPQSGSIKSFNLKAISGDTLTGPPGGGNFGTGFIVLVG
jgi:hypothetical protein